jgi:hypothetical protein
MAVAMTIGTLSRRNGVPVKTLRAYEDMGLNGRGGRADPAGADTSACVDTRTASA